MANKQDEDLLAVEEALRRASVKIYDEIQQHIGWTGDEICKLNRF